MSVIRVSAIVQARMSSERLPGKILREIAGRPLLEYLMDRIQRARTIGSLIVATSDTANDDPVADFCEKHNLACYRGSLVNVAERFGDVLRHYPLDIFVRISGDSPLLDPEVLDRGVRLMTESELNLDIVTNVMPRSFPPGQSVEVIRSMTFLAVLPEIKEPYDLEHVVPYFYRQPDRFTIHNFSAESNYAGVHLAVDKPQDLDRISRLIAVMKKPHWEYSLPEIAILYREVTHSQGEDGLVTTL